MIGMSWNTVRKMAPMTTYFAGMNRFVRSRKSRASVATTSRISMVHACVVSSVGKAQMVRALMTPRNTSLRIVAGIPPKREIMA